MNNTTIPIPSIGDQLELKILEENVPNNIKRSYDVFKVMLDLLDTKDAKLLGEVCHLDEDFISVGLRIAYRSNPNENYQYASSDEPSLHKIPKEFIWMTFDQEKWLKTQRNQKLDGIL